MTFSPNGDAYQIAINFNADDFENAVTVSKLPHDATNWSALKTLIRDSGVRDTCWAFNDKESITADPLDSKYVYAVWDRLTSPSSNCKASFPGLLHSHVCLPWADLVRANDERREQLGARPHGVRPGLAQPDDSRTRSSCCRTATCSTCSSSSSSTRTRTGCAARTSP